jgi:hypothetical protein
MGNDALWNLESWFIGAKSLTNRLVAAWRGDRLDVTVQSSLAIARCKGHWMEACCIEESSAHSSSPVHRSDSVRLRI